MSAPQKKTQPLDVFLFMRGEIYFERNYIIPLWSKWLKIYLLEVEVNDNVIKELLNLQASVVLVCHGYITRTLYS